MDRFFFGGGIFLGSLAGDTFSLANNLGFEFYCGFKFNKNRIVIGYNNNKGLALNNTLEAIPDAQLLYNNNGTFEQSGLFFKMVVAW
jgi:hypothetical protein